MPRQIGIFVDVSNLYYCIGKKYRGRKLDYKKYFNYIREFGTVTVANAYGAQIDNQAEGFLHCLKRVGFSPRYETPKSFSENGVVTKKANYDVKIAVDVLNILEDLDIIVIGSADSDFIPLLKNILASGKKAIVFACKISNDILNLKDVTSIEIPESLIEEKKNVLSKTKTE
jgi:uncharacterized LabA/DUF88 family protein